jgi:hypothetical protein
VKALTLCIAAAIASIDAGATVLYAPTPIGSSARTSDFGDISQSGFRTFDNFTVSLNGYVNKVSWKGFYLGDIQPAVAPAPDVDNWEIAFYSDNAGVPGSQLFFESIAAASVAESFEASGVFNINPNSYNVNYYGYSVALTNPFAFNGGTQYWVSILSRSDYSNPSFALRGATGGDGASYQQTLGPGMTVTGATARNADRAIVLEGTTVPEPGSILLGATGLVLLIAARHRRR